MADNVPANKILWLASYPKSGNTWFRAFISALLNEGEVQINNLQTDGILSSRDIFDNITDINSRDLYEEEAKAMYADVYRHLAKMRDSLTIVKAHDAYECTSESALIPVDATHCALYFIRNPLDVAGSLANHMHCTIQHAVDFLNDPTASLATQANNLNRNSQFSQHLSTWSYHVNSWTSAPFPVLVLRYEDMLQDSISTFTKAVQFVGWQHSQEQIAAALQSASFDALSRQEAEKGFREKNRKSPTFFRSGKMGNWEKELSPGQVSEIIAVNKDVMATYGYLK